MNFKKVAWFLLKVLVLILSILLVYGIIALVGTYVTVNRNQNKVDPDKKKIYLHSNGVHLDIIVPKQYLTDSLAKDLYSEDLNQYFAFGWGDRNFYINTPTWGDLTFKNAVLAMFWKSSTLIHVTRYNAIHKSWKPIYVTDDQLKGVIETIDNSFEMNAEQTKTRLNCATYGDNDDFYEARGSYSCFKTCNTWANSTLKNNGLKACWWTPVSFRLEKLYDEN